MRLLLPIQQFILLPLLLGDRQILLVHGQGILNQVLDQYESNNDDNDNHHGGEMGDTCGRRNPCRNDLDCALSLGRKVCVPLTCFQSAISEAFPNGELEAYSKLILEEAGIYGKDPESVFNGTLLRDKGMDLTREESTQVIYPEYSTGIRRAMERNPLDISGIQNRCSRQNRRSLQDTNRLLFFYGFTFEISAGIKFSFSTIIWGVNLVFRFERFCVGAGPSLHVHTGVLLGFIEFPRGEYETIVTQDTFMMDLIDINLISGGGFSLAFTVDTGTASFEAHSGAGIGGGFGLAGCWNTNIVPCDSSNTLCPLS